MTKVARMMAAGALGGGMMADEADAGYRVGTPVQSVPPRAERAHKYRALWAQVAALAPGEWLPVECATANEARKLNVLALTHRTLRHETRVRGTVVYLRVLPGQELPS